MFYSSGFFPFLLCVLELLFFFPPPFLLVLSHRPLSSRSSARNTHTLRSSDLGVKRTKRSLRARTNGLPGAVHSEGLPLLLTRPPFFFSSPFHTSSRPLLGLVGCKQGEDPDTINRLDELIEEGAYGSVYKVCFHLLFDLPHMPHNSANSQTNVHTPGNDGHRGRSSRPDR